MKQYDNTNRGVLFYNNEKKNERGPDWSGSLNVDGKEYFFDAWTKQGRNGGEFLSVSVKPKEYKAPVPGNSQAPRKHGDRPGGPNNRPQSRSTGFDDMEDAPF